jgi:thiol-disulfide isomerase/thioredoxin
MTEIISAQDLDKFTASHPRAVVFYGSVSCGHCRSITPLVNQLVGEYPTVSFAHCETSRIDVTNLEGIPTFIGYRDNQPVQRVLGADPDSLVDMVMSLA